MPLLHALELLSKTVPNCDKIVLSVHKDDLMKALLKVSICLCQVTGHYAIA